MIFIRNKILHKSLWPQKNIVDSPLVGNMCKQHHFYTQYLGEFTEICLRQLQRIQVQKKGVIISQPQYPPTYSHDFILPAYIQNIWGLVRGNYPPPPHTAIGRCRKGSN
jgi:hypothetical protein